MGRHNASASKASGALANKLYARERSRKKILLREMEARRKLSES